MEGGTEAFPDLGDHCQNAECNQLDFLPFKCDSCRKVFCLDHRSYKSHNCPKSEIKNRKVLVCETCSMSIETTGHDGDDEKAILEKHENSGDCDPKKKKKKPTCSVRRCREVLSFSNTSVCKSCHIKVCLKHRFPADHDCGRNSSSVNGGGVGERGFNGKFLIALAKRNINAGASDCAKEGRGHGGGAVSPPSTPSIKAC